MYEENVFIKDGLLYDTAYGCSKQYRYTNAMCILYLLEFTNRVIIYRCINALGYGRRKIYGINVAEKTY